MGWASGDNTICHLKKLQCIMGRKKGAFIEFCALAGHARRPDRACIGACPIYPIRITGQSINPLGRMGGKGQKKLGIAATPPRLGLPNGDGGFPARQKQHRRRKWCTVTQDGLRDPCHGLAQIARFPLQSVTQDHHAQIRPKRLRTRLRGA